MGIWLCHYDIAYLTTIHKIKMRFINVLINYFLTVNLQSPLG